MGYIVDIDELYSIEQAVSSKCSECSSALEKANSSVDALLKADSLQGDLANSIKTYLKEVHSNILLSIAAALTNLKTRCYCVCQKESVAKGHEKGEQRQRRR